MKLVFHVKNCVRISQFSEDINSNVMGGQNQKQSFRKIDEINKSILVVMLLSY